MKNRNDIFVNINFKVGLLILIPFFASGKIQLYESDKILLITPHNFASFYPQNSSPSLWASYISIDITNKNNTQKITKREISVPIVANSQSQTYNNFKYLDHNLITNNDINVLSNLTYRELNKSKHRIINADHYNNIGILKNRGNSTFNINIERIKEKYMIDELNNQYVVAIDYKLNNKLPEEDLFLILQKIQKTNVPYRDNNYQNFNLNHISSQIFISKAFLNINEFANLAILTIYNFQGRDWLIQPGIEYSVADNILLVPVVNLLSGPNDSFFKHAQDIYNVQIKIDFSF
jgi:hypothetical protein